MPEFVWELPPVHPEPVESVEVTGDAVDHVAGALGRLVTQFRKPKIQALIRCFCGPMQALEQAMIDMLTLRTIDTAVGAQLLVLARIVGQVPLDVDEPTFRSIVRARIRANKSSGMGDQVLLVARLVLSDYDHLDKGGGQQDLMVLRIEHRDRAAFTLRVTNLDVPWSLATIFVEQFLRSIVGDGIRCVCQFFVQHDAVHNDYASGFNFNTGAGFGDAVAGNVGGAFAAAME